MKEIKTSPTPRKSEETLTQFAERHWERRRKEFWREGIADAKNNTNETTAVSKPIAADHDQWVVRCERQRLQERHGTKPPKPIRVAKSVRKPGE